MIDLARNGYTHDEVVQALHSSHRVIDFRYELLDSANRFQRNLQKLETASIKFSMLNTIKRTADFQFSGDEGINFLSERIRPIMRLKMPKKKIQERSNIFMTHVQPLEDELLTEQRESWIEFPMGIFLLSSPSRNSTLSGESRSVTAYGLTQIIHDDKFTSTYTVPSGELVTDAVASILSSSGIVDYNVQGSDKTVARDIQFAIGSKKIDAINHLLSTINYTPIYDDENGYFTSTLYRSPTDRPVDYVYKDDNKSVILHGVEEELDLFNVPNVFVVVRTNPEETPLKSQYTNIKESSPLSTVNRGRMIVDYREIEDIADQASLDAYTERIAFEAAQVYGRIRWRSALMPFHSYANVLQFDFGMLGISGKYLELGWEMQLQVGGVMSHELRQVVAV